MGWRVISGGSRVLRSEGTGAARPPSDRGTGLQLQQQDRVHGGHLHLDSATSEREERVSQVRNVRLDSRGGRTRSATVSAQQSPRVECNNVSSLSVDVQERLPSIVSSKRCRVVHEEVLYDSSSAMCLCATTASALGHEEEHTTRSSSEHASMASSTSRCSSIAAERCGG